MQAGLLLPLVFCALFGAVAAGELAWPAASPASALAMHVPRLARTAAPTAPGDRLAADAATILGRPLFTADRRPAAPSTSASTRQGTPRLSGILVSSGFRRAVFALDGDPKPMIAAVGGRAGPYTVRTIDPNAVVVDTADGDRTLHPVPLPSGAASTDASAAPPSPGLLPFTPHFGDRNAAFGHPSPIENLLQRLRNGGGG